MTVQLKGQKLNDTERGKARCAVILGRISQPLRELVEGFCERHNCEVAELSGEHELRSLGAQGKPAVVFCLEPEGAATDLSRLADCRSEPFARILVCERATISMAVAAMQHGYFSVLDALPDECSFKQLMGSAFESSEHRLHAETQRRRMTDILDRMTEGELLVLKSVVDGHLNKRIAKRLEISERTVEARRKRIFEKTETTSVAMLVRAIVESIGIDELYRRCEAHTRQPPSPHLHLRNTQGTDNSTAPTSTTLSPRGC